MGNDRLLKLDEEKAAAGIKSTLAKDKIHIHGCHHCDTCTHPAHARDRARKKRDFATHGLLPTKWG